VIDAGEQCDRSNFNGETCESLVPGTYGQLSCDPSCVIRTSSCMPLCGNGIVDQGEQCDGGNLNGATCDSLVPGSSGQPYCDPSSCILQTDTCTLP
jgi:hypothetical protein